MSRRAPGTGVVHSGATQGSTAVPTTAADLDEGELT